MALRMVAALSVGLICGCRVAGEACGGVDAPIAIAGAGRSSFALRLWLDSSRLDSVDVWLGRGTLVNRSSDVDCTAALYRFSAPPDTGDLPALQVGDVAPAALPGGGVLIEQHFLPRTGERRYIVPITGVRSFDLTETTWLVGLMCPEADLAIEFVWDLFACGAGDEPPGPGEMGAARLW